MGARFVAALLAGTLRRPSGSSTWRSWMSRALSLREEGGLDGYPKTSVDGTRETEIVGAGMILRTPNGGRTLTGVWTAFQGSRLRSRTKTLVPWN